jgi:hypothetical protein
MKMQYLNPEYKKIINALIKEGIKNSVRIELEFTQNGKLSYKRSMSRTRVFLVGLSKSEDTSEGQGWMVRGAGKKTKYCFSPGWFEYIRIGNRTIKLHNE